MGQHSTPRRVILFGLSANPPTGLGGHAGIVAWAATRRPLAAFDGAPADEVWVLPVYRHAFADKRDMPDFEHRFRMAGLAFESGLPGATAPVRVLDVERTVVERALAETPTARIGTIDVVRHLIANNPGTRFALLLGADTYRDLLEGRWKASQALLELVSVVALPRAGEEVGHEPPDAPALTAISSTAVRTSRDPEFLAESLQPQVLDYIRAHRLYAFAE